MTFDPRWRHLEKEIGLMPWIGAVIESAERSIRGGLPDFRSCSSLFVLSDYGGEHREASHEVLSFLILDPTSLREWDSVWRPARRAHLRDGRRMAFKRLSDVHRARAPPAFLHAADHLTGLLLAVSLHRRLPPLFESAEQSPPAIPGLEGLDRWKRRPFTKLLTAVHVVSLLLAGLSHPGQDVFWFSDEDDLAATPQRLRDVCDVFGRIASHYLSHNLRHFRFGTSKCDDGSKMLEDLLAIPDIFAGSVADVLLSYRRAGLSLSQKVVTLLAESTAPKAAALVPWLGDNGGPLKKLVLSVEPTGEGERKCARQIRFDALSKPPYPSAL